MTDDRGVYKGYKVEKEEKVYKENNVDKER